MRAWVRSPLIPGTDALSRPRATSPFTPLGARGLPDSGLGGPAVPRTPKVAPYPRGQPGGPGACRASSFLCQSGRGGHLCRLSSPGTGVGWAPGPPKLARRPLRPGKGTQRPEPTGSDTFPAASAAAVPRYGEERAPGTSPGASGAPAPRGVCESPWEIPAPHPAPARLPPLPLSGEAAVAPSREPSSASARS